MKSSDSIGHRHVNVHALITLKVTLDPYNMNALLFLAVRAFYNWSNLTVILLISTMLSFH